MPPDCEIATGIVPKLPKGSAAKGSAPKASAPRRVYRLIVTAGPCVGKEMVLDRRELRIGQAANNHLVLPDPTVSRSHCVIENTPRGLLLRDLDSTNGTQVGGAWVERAYLNPLTLIQIGSTTIKVVALESAKTPAPEVEHHDETKMLGSSPAIRRLLVSLPRVASSGVTVLLEGETGTGKSMLAELIHQAGPHATGPFIIVDCGAIHPNLIESELFGHERGSFTGATERRTGAFEAAHGGTIFLDEIGELPLAMQPKLLRALEERTVKRIGSVKSIQVDVRVIAATNRDLRDAVTRGHFRADLYYRLEALRLHLPALRERRDDIPLLIEQFARRVQPDADAALCQSLIRLLGARDEWPGNIRELRNAVEKAVLLGDLGPDPLRATADMTVAQDLSSCFDGSVSFRDAKDRAMTLWEREYLVSLMKHTQGNLSQAARLVRMDRSHLRDLLRRYQIPTP